MKARKTNASKANSSGTSGGGGQNPVVTPTKPPSRDHLLSRDCWCQPEVDGNGPDGLPLEVQIEHQSSVYNGDVETFGTESEWTIKSGSILASLIELQDRRAAGQINAEGADRDSRSLEKGETVPSAPPSAPQTVRVPKDDDVMWILGQPCFAIGGFADILRKGGMDIPRKAESEQAEVAYYCLQMYAKHGADWRKEVGKAMDAMLRAAQESDK